MRIRVAHCAAAGLAVIVIGAAALVGMAGDAVAAQSRVDVIVSVPSLSLGEVTLGDFGGLQTFTISNTTTSPITIDAAGVTFTGPAANDFVASPELNCPGSGTVLTLASTGLPGSSCVIDVFFTPGALGTRAASLTINDTAGSGSSVALSGVGGIGYYQVDAAGKVAYFGDAAFYGDLSSTALNKPIVGMTQTGDDGGYWLVATDGGIFNYGDAGFFGSAGGIRLNKPIVGIAATIDAGGYWLVANDGGIFSYGDAPFYGSTGAIKLNKPIVGIAPTPDGSGYWLVASDGGIFTYGDAQFYGSTGGTTLNKPIVGMAPTPDGGGYWLVASDGGIFAYGDAQFRGSAGSVHLNQPIVSMTAMPDGTGYWFTAADGGLFDYNAPFLGSGVGQGLGTVVDMTTDGAPTLQAFLNIPAARHHLAGSPWGGPPPHARHFAGP